MTVIQALLQHISLQKHMNEFILNINLKTNAFHKNKLMQAAMPYHSEQQGLDPWLPQL